MTKIACATPRRLSILPFLFVVVVLFNFYMQHICKSLDFVKRKASLANLVTMRSFVLLFPAAGRNHFYFPCRLPLLKTGEEFSIDSTKWTV